MSRPVPWLTSSLAIVWVGPRRLHDSRSRRVKRLSFPQCPNIPVKIVSCFAFFPIRLDTTSELTTSKESFSILKICILASSSAGNAAFLSTGRTRILIDAGLSRRETAKRLTAIGEDVEQLDAILLTHEHSDHTSGLAALCGARRKCTVRRVPVYLTHGTAPYVYWGEAADEMNPWLEVFKPAVAFRSAISMSPVSPFHMTPPTPSVLLSPRMASKSQSQQISAISQTRFAFISLALTSWCWNRITISRCCVWVHILGPSSSGSWAAAAICPMKSPPTSSRTIWTSVSVR